MLALMASTISVALFGLSAGKLTEAPMLAKMSRPTFLRFWGGIAIVYG